ncbi:MAG: HutD family protein [Kofleriaceae bacterium]
MTRVLGPDDWQAQPWRNGRGTTHEIWRDADDYALRVSCAEVAASGPFSQFPGFRRWTFLLGPAPIRLGEHELVKPGDHLELPGDLALEATVGEPTRLLNILARHDLGVSVGYGLATHPVQFVFALQPLAELTRWHAIVLAPPARFERRTVIWIR